MSSATFESRPIWSVMVPVYNRTRYLTEALDSVIIQAPDQNKMQIEVIDNCSTENDVTSLVNKRYGDRISVFRQAKHVSMADNWNGCVARASGQLIHILHDDDFVADGYYSEIESLANKYPRVGLYATRNFLVDDDSMITGVSDRIRDLENPTREIESFFYQTPIQCAGVTIRRSVYESIGGFRADMGYVVDCEMWARVTSSNGAVVSSRILAFYRRGTGTDTHRLLRSAEGIKDICRLNEFFAQQYGAFCVQRGRDRVSRMAWEQYQKFLSIGDDEAAANNYAMWRDLTPLSQRIARQIAKYVIRIGDLGIIGAMARICRKLSGAGSLSS